MEDAVNGSSLTPEEKVAVKNWLEGDRTDWSGLQMVGAIAQMGDILTKDKVESNIWKKRMLKAGLEAKGLEFPEGFDKLPEVTKEARLNEVIGVLTEKKKKKKNK